MNFWVLLGLGLVVLLMLDKKQQGQTVDIATGTTPQGQVDPQSVASQVTRIPKTMDQVTQEVIAAKMSGVNWYDN